MPEQPKHVAYALMPIPIISEAIMALLEKRFYVVFAAAMVVLPLLAAAGYRTAFGGAYAATFLLFVSFSGASILTVAFGAFLIVPVFASYSLLQPGRQALMNANVTDTGERHAALFFALRFALLCVSAIAAAFMSLVFSGQLGIRITSILILLPVLGFGLLIIVIAGRTAARPE